MSTYQNNLTYTTITIDDTDYYISFIIDPPEPDVGIFNSEVLIESCTPDIDPDDHDTWNRIESIIINSYSPS